MFHDCLIPVPPVNTYELLGLEDLCAFQNLPCLLSYISGLEALAIDQMWFEAGQAPAYRVTLRLERGRSCRILSNKAKELEENMDYRVTSWTHAIVKLHDRYDHIPGFTIDMLTRSMMSLSARKHDPMHNSPIFNRGWGAFPRFLICIDRIR